MRFVPIFILTAIGSIVVFLTLELQSVLHLNYRYEVLASYLFCICMSVLYYTKADANKKLLKSITLALMPLLLLVCFIVICVVLIFTSDELIYQD